MTSYSVDSELSMMLDQSRGAQAEALNVQVYEDIRGPMDKNQMAHGQILVSKGMRPWELCKPSFKGNKESRNYSTYVKYNKYSKFSCNVDMQTNENRTSIECISQHTKTCL